MCDVSGVGPISLSRGDASTRWHLTRESGRRENEGGRDHADKHRANMRRYRQRVLPEKTVLSYRGAHNQIQSEYDREC